MRYALLIHYPQPAISTLTEEDIEAGMAAFRAYAKALSDAGVLLSAEVLETVASATSVSLKNGSLQIQDGPFADTKEQFAGIFMIDVPDLDAALVLILANHIGDIAVLREAITLAKRRVIDVQQQQQQQQQ